MEEQVDRLVQKVWDKYQNTPPNQRLLIAIGGIPGSGKTTLSQLIVNDINDLATVDTTAENKDGGDDDDDDSQPDGERQIDQHGFHAPAAFIPMDGFHLTRAQLSAMPNPDEAHARRGAVFTFDGDAFHKLVKALREPLDPFSTNVIHAPSFDHAVKDPKQDDIAIEPWHRLLVFEGNYVALDKSPWKDAAALMDELWFVDVDFEVARKRLIARHVKAGIAKDEADADKRVRENDLVNGKEIVDFRLKLDELIVSRDDREWDHE